MTCIVDIILTMAYKPTKMEMIDHLIILSLLVILIFYLVYLSLTKVPLIILPVLLAITL
jgi:hypothetical protein